MFLSWWFRVLHLMYHLNYLLFFGTWMKRREKKRLRAWTADSMARYYCLRGKPSNALQWCRIAMKVWLAWNGRFCLFAETWREVLCNHRPEKQQVETNTLCLALWSQHTAVVLVSYKWMITFMCAGSMSVVHNGDLIWISERHWELLMHLISHKINRQIWRGTGTR